MSTYELRLAAPGDDEAIGELLVTAFVERYAKKLPEVVVTERRQRELRDVAGKRAVATVWVVTKGEEVVGTVAAWAPGAPGSEAWRENAADLRHLAVRPGSPGVAALLLDAAERWARERGCAAMCLHVRRGALGVRALYEGRGYVREAAGDIDALPEVFLEALSLRLG